MSILRKLHGQRGVSLVETVVARIAADALIDPLGEVYIIAWQTVNF